MQEDKLLTTATVADRLCVSRSTVLNLIRTNKLRATRINPQTIRIYESSVDTLLHAGAINAS
jgi:excisionase family DNA binding protein